ncbi:hypothetical protein JX265_005263 [Neoarthrinium moseri]|uniref:Uncharacterized protein n=1 Tax=Neoarthrinium moseri TaxID=1658444 RepID=A0A9Q0ART1_9PEZI|nr:hypothetical protein JX266_008497 [Neoarthrinium moseri]KAI1873641.1 hypothetical protein JX265_005263 [Neoarthrinium moseri]
MFEIDGDMIEKMTNVFGQLPILQYLSKPTITLANYEAAIYTGHLNQVRVDIFPRDDMGMSADNYLDYIPIAWTTINAANNFQLSGEEMWETMVISMLNYQVDEYMECVVARLDISRLQDLEMSIGTEVRNTGPQAESSLSLYSTKLQPTNLTLPRSDQSSPSKDLESTNVAEVLCKYIRHVKQHKALLRSQLSTRERALHEPEKFLLAHLAHNADNAVCWEILSPNLDEAIRVKMQAFIGVTDQFGQIYVARDVASRRQKEKGASY